MMTHIMLSITNHEQELESSEETVQSLLQSKRRHISLENETVKTYLKKKVSDLQKTETYIPFHPWIVPTSTPKNHTWRALDLFTGRQLVVRKQHDCIELLY